MFNEIQWKQYIKLYDSETEGSPYSVQWIIWCWRKPIWQGLPLLLLFIPILCVDFLYVIIAGIIIWSRH